MEHFVHLQERERERVREGDIYKQVSSRQLINKIVNPSAKMTYKYWWSELV